MEFHFNLFLQKDILISRKKKRIFQLIHFYHSLVFGVLHVINLDGKKLTKRVVEMVKLKKYNLFSKFENIFSDMIFIFNKILILEEEEGVKNLNLKHCLIS